jgi:hypothetical protein
MDIDPYFSGKPMTKPVPRRRRRWIGRSLLVPLLILSGCHMAMAGSPVPLWHIERLGGPVAVAAISPEALVLVDGRRVPLPFIKRLPRDDPAFVRALRPGVEVGDEGEVFGLIGPRRTCGNDPVVFYGKRIDLSELAGLLDPDGIDDSIVPPEAIRDFKEGYGLSRDRCGMPYDVMVKARLLGRIYEAAKERPERQPFSSTPIAPN